ncbi:hypothetical protein [Paenibacillus sp. NPDC093718]|uniref:hypothetical protein n=1 Tax=Paenibacillus sp. NPDC093718 TaxID=3390601 RepID=UPI003CFFD816
MRLNNPSEAWAGWQGFIISHERVEVMNTAQWDQLMTSLRDTAEIMAKYRDELLKQGFNRNEALVMVIEYQNVLTGKKS